MTPAELAQRLAWLYRERERLLREFDAAYDQKVGPHGPGVPIADRRKNVVQAT